MSDDSNTGNQAIKDDQELASVLQNMGSKDNSAQKDDATMSYEETPAIEKKSKQLLANPDEDVLGTETEETEASESAKEEVKAPSFQSSPTDTSSLEALKRTALEELRPLVGKLDLPPKEKFDTMLLIIRSTDDQSLLEPAHVAAKDIEDDTERAEALLDIVKEIDYFSSQDK